MKMFKQLILKWLVSEIKDDVSFHKYIMEKCDEYYSNETLKKHRIWGDKSKLQIGEGAQLNNALINTVSGSVVIGENSFLGHHVSLLTGTHEYESRGEARKNTFPDSGRDILIGKGVWVASNVLVLGPCTIGDNAVIGAGSVVTGKVEENALYVGVPARFKRHI